uniref:hypothetical protein n=1 Tax=Sphaerisporangium sp. CA-236357 TaxID=3240030 RepID=UPI003F495723
MTLTAGIAPPLEEVLTMERNYTADQIRDMVTHIQGCQECCGDDQEILASLYDESLPPAELADHIQITHSAEWRAFLDRNRGD